MAAMPRQKPDLDETTRRIAERMLNMPPKPHSAMKLGKPRAKSPSARKPNSKAKKPSLGRKLLLED
jgi:hypothetical protein